MGLVMGLRMAQVSLCFQVFSAPAGKYPPAMGIDEVLQLMLTKETTSIIKRIRFVILILSAVVKGPLTTKRLHVKLVQLDTLTLSPKGAFF